MSRSIARGPQRYVGVRPRLRSRPCRPASRSRGAERGVQQGCGVHERGLVADAPRLATVQPRARGDGAECRRGAAKRRLDRRRARRRGSRLVRCARAPRARPAQASRRALSVTARCRAAKQPRLRDRDFDPLDAPVGERGSGDVGAEALEQRVRRARDDPRRRARAAPRSRRCRRARRCARQP